MHDHSISRLISSIQNGFKVFFIVAMLASCTTMPPNAKPVSESRRQEIVQDIIESGDLIDLFKNAEKIYENEENSFNAFEISKAVEKYLRAHTKTPEQVYRLIQANKFTEHVFRKNPDEMADTTMCKILKKCDQGIVGRKIVGSYYLLMTKKYEISVEFLKGEIVSVSAYMKAGY